MGNPVINTSTNTITGHVAIGNVTTTATNVLTAASNTILKIHSIIIANETAGSSTKVHVWYYSSATSYAMATEMEIPVGNTLVVIDKRLGLSLIEGDSIRLQADDNSVLDYTIPYEKITT